MGKNSIVQIMILFPNIIGHTDISLSKTAFYVLMTRNETFKIQKLLEDVKIMKNLGLVLIPLPNFKLKYGIKRRKAESLNHLGLNHCLKEKSSMSLWFEIGSFHS